MKRAGYTLIEVMMALGVLSAGSVGIMAMHQAATRGNMEARQMSVANQLTQRWVERLRRDSLYWTTGAPAPDPTLLARTSYLRGVAAPGTNPSWVIPEPPAISGETANFDYYGNDTAVPASMTYCTNVRLEWLYPGRSMRADVRVWWVRRSAGNDGANEFTGCAGGLDSLTGEPRVRMVYASTVLRFNRRQ